jgi:hypothetical protein
MEDGSLTAQPAPAKTRRGARAIAFWSAVVAPLAACLYGISWAAASPGFLFGEA